MAGRPSRQDVRGKLLTSNGLCQIDKCLNVMLPSGSMCLGVKPASRALRVVRSYLSPSGQQRQKG